MTTQNAKKLILASASPRRRELLTEAGYEFTVIPSAIDESEHITDHPDPAEIAIRIAAGKARDIAHQITTPAVVLGADTIVVCNNEILGKAPDPDTARKMLHTLSRTHHRVITGIVLIETPTGHEIRRSDTSWITMRPMSPEEIDAYIATGSWIDKAGAYAVQEGADKFILRIDGSYSNVVGLPIELVQKLLTEAGIHPTK